MSIKNLVDRVKYVAAGSILAVLPGVAFAAPTPDEAQGVGIDQIAGLIQFIVRWVFEIGAIVVVFFLVWGGLAYMLAGGNAEKAETARTRIINAIIGGVVIAGAYLIMRTIGIFVTSIGNY